jgi:epoxyqueuosine reductase QueG
MDDEAFRSRFAGTPLTRPKAQGMRRNAGIALGNAARERAGAPPFDPT